MRRAYRTGRLDDAILLVGAALIVAAVAAVSYEIFERALIAGGLVAAIVGAGLVYLALQHAADIARAEQRAKTRGETPDVPGADR